ncbi:MAG TPA: CPBP family intramembrane glutamic endopeptidase, partial [Candidatus Limnocylindrales bacterium]
IAGVRAPETATSSATAVASGAGLGRAVLVLAGLATVVGLRWAAIVDGRLGGIAIGLVFGIALLGVGLAGRRLAGLPLVVPPSTRAAASDAALGLAGGLALIGIALVTTLAAAGAVRPNGLAADLAGPWLVATVVVALAEDLILRGVLFGMLERAARWPFALFVTSAAFALMHVPVYGWHVVPLDLGVGLFLGGLRLATGGWLAPGVAHVVADVATWWL